MSNGDPIRAGEQTVAFQTTCMFAEAQNYNFPSGSPMYFVGAPINTGNISTTDLDGLIARGNQGGSGVVGWGGTGQGTGVIGAGGVNFVFSNNGHTFIQEGGDGVEGAGGPGRSGFTLGSGLTPGGTTQPIEGGSGVLGYGGAGVGAGNIPENATNGVAANAGMGVFGRGGERPAAHHCPAPARSALRQTRIRSIRRTMFSRATVLPAWGRLAFTAIPLRASACWARLMDQTAPASSASTSSRMPKRSKAARACSDLDRWADRV
jgi:hypothetical protein